MITCEFENGNKARLRHVVVDSLVLMGDKILLVKRAARLIEGGKWGLVGGFVDRDETIKEAVAREVLEETGYTVDKITLFHVIDVPDRPNEDRQNVSFVHFCTALEKIAAADDESDEQKWFSLSALPSKEEMAFDHFSSIQLYQDYLKQPFPLPRV
ncbi:MAG: NUDIX hydrolase [Bdellovibrionales bacterium]